MVSSTFRIGISESASEVHLVQGVWEDPRRVAGSRTRAVTNRLTGGGPTKLALSNGQYYAPYFLRRTGRGEKRMLACTA
jgi:hypothetical protein